MEWLDRLTISLALTQKQQQKAAQKEKNRVYAHCMELDQAIYDLGKFLSDLCFAHSLSIKQADLDQLQELAPLFPMAEVLSMQGNIGTNQKQFLQSYLNIYPSRYNIAQFTNAAIHRTGMYPKWRTLAGLDENHCGSIWHTVIELICRQRDPQLLQRLVDLLGTIFYRFWLLENATMSLAEVRYGRIISHFNRYAQEDQQTPYLHAVMLLQAQLAEVFGGTEADFEPCPDEENFLEEIDSEPCLNFTVHRNDTVGFLHFYAVRIRNSPKSKDLIWELPPVGHEPVVFFKE